MTAPHPSRRTNSHSARRYASPAAAPTRGRPRPQSAARATAASGSGAKGPARRQPPERSARGYARAHVGGLTLTTRAALLGLALCAVVLTLAYPAREYLAQHRQINQLASAVAKDRADLASLKAAALRDSDPRYVEAQARLRLHMQRPGDLVFQLPPAIPKAAGKQKAGSVHTPVLPGRAAQPWYSQLYRSTVESGK